MKDFLRSSLVSFKIFFNDLVTDYIDVGAVLCFGGGVLLSTVFIHIVREVRESLEKATFFGIKPTEIDFPFAELLICMGIYVVFHTL